MLAASKSEPSPSTSDRSVDRIRLVHLTIEKLVYGGEGLARLPADDYGPGKAAFVPFVLPGEKVEATLREHDAGLLVAANAALRVKDMA